MDNPNITMEEYIRLEEEKARRRGKVYNWETATYGKIWDNEDVYDLEFIETEFPVIVFNGTLTSEAALSCEPTVSSLNDEIDFRISFGESDDEDCTTLFFSTVNTAYSLNEYSVLDTGPRWNENDEVGGVFINLEILKCWSLETSRRFLLNNEVNRQAGIEELKSELFENGDQLRRCEASLTFWKSTFLAFVLFIGSCLCNEIDVKQVVVTTTSAWHLLLLDHQPTCSSVDCVEGMHDMLSGHTNIGPRRMGELDIKVFYDVCKEKLGNEEAQIKASELCTLWQDKTLGGIQ
ncbi:putative reverse transcriptase domain-containing protein [Tanacetum coccineum]